MEMNIILPFNLLFPPSKWLTSENLLLLLRYKSVNISRKVLLVTLYIYLCAFLCVYRNTTDTCPLKSRRCQRGVSFLEAMFCSQWRAQTPNATGSLTGWRYVWFMDTGQGGIWEGPDMTCFIHLWIWCVLFMCNL